LDPETRVITAGPSAKAVAVERASGAILDCLGKAGPTGMKRADLLKAVGGKTTILGEALRELVKEQRVVQTKTGKTMVYTRSGGEKQDDVP
jgi:hypothetical protein